MRTVWLLSVVAGCYSPTPGVGAPCGPGGECPSGQTCSPTGTCGGGEQQDAKAIDAPPVVTFTPSNGVNLSALTGVDQALPGNGAIVIDTDTGEITRDGTTIRAAGAGLISGIGFELRPTLGVFAITGITLTNGNTLVARGSRGLVLLASGTIRIRGTLSVSGGLCPTGQLLNSCGGPGGGTGGVNAVAATGCGPGGRGADAGDTGGGGGGFGDPGAAGGAETDNLMSPGGLGGAIAACPPASLEPLAGGGGGGSSGGAGGAGGGGGGAIQLTALGSVEVPGVIVAGGAGGAGAIGAGGGGGGAGGAILLEAPTVDLTGAIVAANGGGGGEGAVAVAGAAGGTACPAQGGDTTGRAGGDGGCLATQPTAGEMNVNDTGGGGGGAGRIRINATMVVTATSVISPAPSIAELKP